MPTLNASERALLARPELATAAAHFAAECAASREHMALVRRALNEHGDHGPAISGVIRDHFPADVKDKLRGLCARINGCSFAAWSARPPRVRPATLRALARAVATRDGSGFYGPQGRAS